MSRFKFVGCSVEGCQAKHYGKGFCRPHYMRNWNGRDPAGRRSTPARDYMEEWLAKDTDECFTWPYSTFDCGYPRIRLNKKDYRVHTIACEQQNGPKPFEGAVVRHLCGNGLSGCFNPKHLVWGTVLENNLDRITHETMPRGEDHFFATLKDAEVIEIYKDGRTAREIAKDYNVTKSAIYCIKNGKTWSWLTGHKKKEGGD